MNSEWSVRVSQASSTATSRRSSVNGVPAGGTVMSGSGGGGGGGGVGAGEVRWTTSHSSHLPHTHAGTVARSAYASHDPSPRIPSTPVTSAAMPSAPSRSPPPSSHGVHPSTSSVYGASGATHASSAYHATRLGAPTQPGGASYSHHHHTYASGSTTGSSAYTHGRSYGGAHTSHTSRPTYTSYTPTPATNWR